MTENLNDKIIIYQSEDGKTQLDVKLEGETVWLTQAQMVELFQSSKATISEHIKHIIEDDELDANSTVRKFRTVVTFYSILFHKRYQFLMIRRFFILFFSQR